jgi:hypothetical protein
MKRILALLLLVVALCAMSIGPANAQLEPLDPLGVPMPQAPGWWKWTPDGATANVTPGTAPTGWGSSSLRMTTGTNQAIVNTDVLLAPGLTKISSITELSYWTFGESSGQSTEFVRVPTLQLGVDVDGDLLWDTNLVYEPFFNGFVFGGQWQQWNTLTGVWYSTRDIGIADQNNPRTLNEIFNHDNGAYFEMAFSLLGSDPLFDVRFQYGTSGGGYPGAVGRVDGLEFQLRNVPEMQHDFEGLVPHIVHLLQGIADGD